MSKIKGTKRSLIGSIMALVFCCSIFMGATFAWFTDTATTGVNKVQAGNLDVDLVNKNGVSLVGKHLEFIKAPGAEGQPILWEPGCTYKLPEIYVRNNGNLALKYKIAISGISNGDAKLLEAIEFKIKDQTGEARPLSDYEDTLNAKATNSTGLVIEATMNPSAGNEYQGLSIEGIAITVHATQDTVEFDSSTDEYDEQAEYPVIVSTQKELDEAVKTLEKDEKILLPKGKFNIPAATANKEITIIGAGEATVIDCTKAQALPNAKITFENLTIQGINNNYIGLQHTSRVTYLNCTINSKITLYASDVDFINCTFKGTGDYIWTYGSDNVLFDNCTFDNTNSKAILVYQERDNKVSNVIVKNCNFKAAEKGYNGNREWTAAVEVDSSLAPANVIIEKCTFDATNYNGIVRHKLGSNATITVDGVVQK